MAGFDADIHRAAAEDREVELETIGRQTGAPHRVTIWIVTDGERLFIRSGQGLGRHWPQNVLHSGTGRLRLRGRDLAVNIRLLQDPGAARRVSELYVQKYRLSPPGTDADGRWSRAEAATFELLPAA